VGPDRRTRAQTDDADYERAIELHRIDLLMAGTEVVALIEVVCEPGCLFIENVAVEPRHQGKGYGRLLLAHAEELQSQPDARRSGFIRIA